MKIHSYTPSELHRIVNIVSFSMPIVIVNSEYSETPSELHREKKGSLPIGHAYWT